MGNVERFECTRRRCFVRRRAVDIALHGDFDSRQQPIEFVAVTLGYHLHPAIGQVADKAGHIKVSRDVPCGEAKPHALHAALEICGQSLHSAPSIGPSTPAS